MIDEKKKKVYVPPEAKVVTFYDEGDIICLSAGDTLQWGGGTQEDF